MALLERDGLLITPEEGGWQDNIFAAPPEAFLSASLAEEEEDFEGYLRPPPPTTAGLCTVVYILPVGVGRCLYSHLRQLPPRKPKVEDPSRLFA